MRESISRPFCPDCFDLWLQNREDFSFGCDLCGYGREVKIDIEVVEQAAEALRSGKVVRFGCSYGNFAITLPRVDWNDVDYDILVRDLAALERYFVATPQESAMMAAIEKPTVLLRKSFEFRKEFEYIDDEIFYVRLVDDLSLYALFEKLDEPFIFLTTDEVACDLDLGKESSLYIEPLKINVGVQKILLLQGERGVAQIGRGVSFDLDLFSEVADLNDTGAEYATLYLSKEQPSYILLYSPKYGWREMLRVAFDLQDMRTLFEYIKKDETGSKLLQNYQNRFPIHYERLKSIKFSTPCRTIYELWGVVALVLGISKSDNLYDAALAFEYKTLEFLGKKGQE